MLTPEITETPDFFLAQFQKPPGDKKLVGLAVVFTDGEEVTADLSWPDHPKLQQQVIEGLRHLLHHHDAVEAVKDLGGGA